MKEKLLSPWLTVRTQFVLAAVFVVASVAKIADPPGFAHQLHNYQLAPPGAVNALALVLPCGTERGPDRVAIEAAPHQEGAQPLQRLRVIGDGAAAQMPAQRRRRAF